MPVIRLRLHKIERKTKLKALSKISHYVCHIIQFKNDDNSMDSESESSRDEEEPELGYANKQHPILPPGESQQIRSISEDFNEALFLCSGTFGKYLQAKVEMTDV